jgi:hypothetical protein
MSSWGSTSSPLSTWQTLVNFENSGIRFNIVDTLSSSSPFTTQSFSLAFFIKSADSFSEVSGFLNVLFSPEASRNCFGCRQLNRPECTLGFKRQNSRLALELDFTVPKYSLWKFTAIIQVPHLDDTGLWGGGARLFLEVEIEANLRLTVSQYILVSNPFWDLWPHITSCLKVSVCILLFYINVWGVFSDERTSLQFAVQSLNGPSRAELVAILYCLTWDFPTWRARFLYLYPPGT